jgi:hypothetical protein
MPRVITTLSLLAAGILIGTAISPLGGSGATTTSTPQAPVPVVPGVGTFADSGAPYAAGCYCGVKSDVISGKLLAYGLPCRSARKELKAWADSPKRSGFIHGFRCMQSSGGRTDGFRCVQTQGIQFVSRK